MSMCLLSSGLAAGPAPLASPSLRQLQKQLESGGASDGFWTGLAARGTPLTEAANVQPALAPGEVLLTFVWRGASREVVLLGGPAAHHANLQRLGQSDTWFASFRVPDSLRLSYQFAPDPPVSPADRRHEALLAVAQPDPHNPRRFVSGPSARREVSSVLELANAPPARWLAPGSAASGHWREAVLDGMATRHPWLLSVYRPPGFVPGAPGNGLLLLFDGERWRDQVGPVLDALAGSGKIRPTAVVLLHNADALSRRRDLPPNPAFDRFLRDGLRPWLGRQGLLPRREQVIISGASYGGLAAAWAGLVQGDWIGVVHAQSGSFWWSPGWESGQDQPGWLMRQVGRQPFQPVRFYLQAGLYESGGAHPILESSRHLSEVLQTHGYPVHSQVFVAGHDAYHWLATLGDAIVAAQ